ASFLHLAGDARHSPCSTIGARISNNVIINLARRADWPIPGALSTSIASNGVIDTPPMTESL
ncbi:MAG TPA: hypothetical protein VJ810_15415, partial [Blastocatellia bacterium]|nr:hypothetical protein [Blastocatellia bacterium]